MAIYYSDNIQKLEIDSNILHVYPNALVQLYKEDETTLAWEGTADGNGNVFINTKIADGKYFLHVDGTLVKVIQHINADDAREFTKRFFISGDVTADFDSDATRPVYLCEEALDIVKVKIIVHHVNATGDATVHILKGVANDADYVTVASDSEWSYRIYPAQEYYYYKHVDNSPGVALVANDVVAIGVDWTANTISGITIELTFKSAQ